MGIQFYFQQQEYIGQPYDDMATTYGEFNSHPEAALHAGDLSRELNMVIWMHQAGKKEYFQYDASFIPPIKCRLCRHWREKALTKKAWGICDNPKNEIKIGTALIGAYVEDTAMREELRGYIEDGIRYPEDFGCIFFEPTIDKK